MSVNDLLFFLAFLVTGYVTGTILERRHYQSIRMREKELIGLPAVTIKRLANENQIEDSWLVVGEVVISIDYFKGFLAFLKGLVGGDIGAYETLLDRGRREAILRMKEKAKGADIVINTRIETSAIAGKESGNNKRISGVELYAYGTAIRYRKLESHALHTTPA